jgi:hypothetical protein
MQSVPEHAAYAEALTAARRRVRNGLRERGQVTELVHAHCCAVALRQSALGWARQHRLRISTRIEPVDESNKDGAYKFNAAVHGTKT